jgi:hypothetical protein
MKSKKTIALLFLVVGIWGAIAYQVYQQMFTEEPVAEFSFKPIEKKQEDTTQQYILQFNYRDPFLVNVEHEQKKQDPKKLTKDVSSVVNVPRQVAIPPWERFIFLGSVYNANKKMHVALIRVNGIDHMPKTGEIIDGFEILAIYKDSVEVGFDAEKKLIKKN